VRTVEAPPVAAVAATNPATRAATRPGPAERGRVRVALGGTVSTDRGTRLRGATLQLDSPDAVTTAPALNGRHWRNLRDLKLNAVRFDVKLRDAHPLPVTLERQLPKLDRAVDLAAGNGMYIIIMNSAAAGTYDKQELLRFWSVVAPRYKDRTHVLYEMVNEPVSWEPRHYSEKHVKDLKEVYDVMRRAAPETHIVLWTFPNLNGGPETARTVESMQGVFYTRESVGFHWYRATADAVSFLQSRYPLLMTETSPGPPPTDDLAVLQQCENLGVSWVHLEGKTFDLSKLKALLNRLHEGGVDWAAEWDRNVSLAGGPR
jgi:hypothetical protein